MRALLLLTLVPALALANPFGGTGGASCGVNMSCSAATYTATTASGTGYACSSAVTTCLDPGPGANNGIGTDASGRLILGTGDGTAEVRIGGDNNIVLWESGILIIGNGAFVLNASGFMVNQTGTKPVLVDDEHGFRITPYAIASLRECGAEVSEGTHYVVAAAAGVPTGLCTCTSDGAATPAYRWVRQNMHAGTFTQGTATTCNP